MISVFLIYYFNSNAFYSSFYNVFDGITLLRILCSLFLNSIFPHIGKTGDELTKVIIRTWETK